MATVNAILNTKYKSKDDTYPIVICIRDGEKQRRHNIGFKVDKVFFDNGQVIEDHPEAEIINSVIDEKVLEAKRYFAACKLKKIPPDIDLVFKEIKSHSFTDYLLHRAKQHKEADQPEMYYKLERYVREFRRCFGRENIYFAEITADFLRTYDSWLQKDIQGATKRDSKKKNSANTRNKKFEFLAKYYNNAIDEGKASPPNHFKNYQIRTTPTKKEKLTKEQVQAIENLPLKDGLVSLARDIFMFSYYCRGIRFENCILMKKTSIANGRLYFTTNKGKKNLSVPIHDKLQAIIDRYVNNDTDTIFGRLNTSDADTNTKKRRSVGSENSLINKRLKIVAELAEIPIPLSMHYSRHSFAFHLKKKTNNIHVIKQSLGHSRTQVTEIYLDELDDEAIDSVVGTVYE